MSKKQRINSLKKRFKKLIKEGKVSVSDIQQIDFEADVDETLSYKENLGNLLGKYHYCKELENDASAEKRHVEDIEEQFDKEFKESVKQLKGGEQEHYFATLKKYVEMVGKGYATSLLLEGRGGIGKTYEVLKTLGECDTDYVFINSYSTPLEFYQLLYENHDRVIVLDDFEGVLSSKVGTSILKSALWSATDKRIVSYYTTSEKCTVPHTFEFSGRIIFCLNSIEDNPELRALVSRTLYYKLDFPLEDIKRIIMAIANGDTTKTQLDRENRVKVAQFIIENSNEATKDLNLRTLIKAFWAYEYATKESTDWQDLVLKMLEADEEKALILELKQSCATIEDMAKEFTRRTGRSRRTFYRLKREMGLSRKYS